MNAQKFKLICLKRMKYDKKCSRGILQCILFDHKGAREISLRISGGSGRYGAGHFMKLYTMETPSYVKAPAKWLGKFSDNFVIDQLRASRPELGLLESHPSDFDLEKTIVKFDLKNAMSHLDEISQKIIYLNYWERYSLRMSRSF